MDKVKNGIDVLQNNIDKIKNMNIGLITNHTGVNAKLKSTIDVFNETSGLVCLFSPEHGVRGDFQAGDQVPDYIDNKTGVKVYSLYGNTKKPTEDMLRNIDAIFFDIQDIGARYYTYLYTMAYAMQSAKEFHKKFVVLDRPNPINGTQMDGNILDPEFSSFVGMYPIPMRYGMTIGELARLFNYEFDIGCDLEVVKMEGWTRNMYFDDTNLVFIAPSPNISTIATAILYAGTCLFEGTNVSEGRGTTQPFQLIGAPWMDCYRLADEMNGLNIEGVIFRPHHFIPTFSKYSGQLCHGVQIHIIDRNAIRSFEIAVYLIANIYENYEEFKFLSKLNSEGQKRYFFDLLAGTDRLRKSIVRGTYHEYINRCISVLERFNNIRYKYLLYEP